ncbi:bifunctional acetate--CoA ligase family protein/GNAT family N-acetyltransferase [Streptomyces turgidiscabies]|uniref:Acyl-CoA synthetase (NDP forming)/GNAT superfamily N-acetyltransferase n=1 Tax=Streptomyces turgidiscabies TaxID=85558 RepID=A0ABU0S0F9_9ACTN|nr:bifunctional GNAT family N-acetyltransferase/acetate--CoA ligase family protein [Streptomyces turgidiscabies]MDQ0937733.1 acyl-CoA synthetase (NDP forming)/GNAT superfamily N-acetyltransferase [Streptomyces turgidiscabies]
MQNSSDRHEYPAHWEADVVLRDGGTARVRPITADDADRLISFYEQVSDESKYYRFFAPYPRLSAKDVHRFTHHDFVDRVGLAATVGGEFIATVRYDRIDADGMPASGPANEAEVAFLVQDAHQGRGVASALLEHIGAVARERGIRRFAAEVLPANTKMIKVFTDAGYTQKRSFEDGVVRLEFDLEPTDRSLAVQRAREQRAEARSVRRLLAPGAVAVVGVGRAPGGVGRSVLDHIRDAGFTGDLYAVNSAFPEDQKDIDGCPARRSVRDIEGPVDLAVVAVPAAYVPDVVTECGEHGVQGLVVVSAGYAESGPEGRERQRELVRHARTYGMRIIGPNAFGVINTAADVRLNASLAPEMPRPGRIGLFAQSGAVGIALLSRLHRRGGGVTGVTGVSTFVSSGNRADVSGNDVLQYWYDDPDTDVVLMYLESIGNPRKFTRLARRTAAAKPLVVVQGARHSGAAPQGHAVRATRLSHATVSELLRQAGVIRVDTITELVDAGLLLARQPLPAGPRVAILGNSESLGLLTYDACLSEGLRPLPPLDLTTGASPEDFHRALAQALAGDTCDAVVVTAIPTVGEASARDAALAEALRSAAAEVPGKPVLVVHVELGGLAEALSAATSTAPQAGSPASGTTGGAQQFRPVERPPTAVAKPPPAAPPQPSPSPAPDSCSRLIPAYPAAERAVRALGEAVKYAQWRREAAEPGKVPESIDVDIDEKRAADLISGLLARGQGLTLGTEETRELLGTYGIAVRGALPAPSPDDAVAAARTIGYPVALKATAPHLRHRADLGGVRLDLADEEQLRRAYAELTGLFGNPDQVRPVVQGMAPRGVDTVVRAVIDPAAGAVLSFGLAGPASQLLGDIAHRLIPVTDRDAASLIRSIRTAPILFGWRGSAPVDSGALEELLLRVSRLVDDHPEVIAVSLEPVVVAQHGLSVLGASVRLAPPPVRDDLGPRTLPVY